MKRKMKNNLFVIKSVKLKDIYFWKCFDKNNNKQFDFQAFVTSTNFNGRDKKKSVERFLLKIEVK